MDQIPEVLRLLAALWLTVGGIAVLTGYGRRYFTASRRAAGRALTWAPRRIWGAWSREIVCMLIGAGIILLVLANNGLLPR